MSTPRALNELTIRPADPAADAAPCAAIYAPHVESGEFAARIEALSATHAWLVAEVDGALAGFAYACRHRSRPAYRWAADVSVYVDPRHQGRGVGRALYSALFDELRTRRFRQFEQLYSARR